MNEIVLTTKAQLREELKSVLREIELEKTANIPTKVFTINSVAKALGLAHATVKKLVASGHIKSTKSGLITESAVNDYLNR